MTIIKPQCQQSNKVRHEENKRISIVLVPAAWMHATLSLQRSRMNWRLTAVLKKAPDTYLSVSWRELPLDRAIDLKKPFTAGTAYVITGLAT